MREDDDGQHVTWNNGDRTFLPWDDMPHHHPADAARPQRADFDTFDPDRDLERIDGFLGYVWNVLFHMQEVPGKPDAGLLRPGTIPEYMFRAFDIVKERAGADLSIHGSAYSPLSHYFELFGYEAALTGFMTDPGKAHATLDRLTGNTIAWAVALVERGADAVDLSSAFVAAPFLSRRMYSEFVVPYERRVNEAVRRAGGRRIYAQLRPHRRPARPDGTDRHAGHRHAGSAAAGQLRYRRRPNAASASACSSRAI